MIIRRNLHKILETWLFRGKILIVYGARQVGKTTLVKALLEEHDASDGYYNCEVPTVLDLLVSKEPIQYKKNFGHHKILVLDEAQNVPDIGSILKIMSDEMPELQVIATGSSSFELAQKTSAPLTGRALGFTLYPFSYSELQQLYRPVELKAELPHWLIMGTYPEIVLAGKESARILLDDLANKYLFKDILIFENLRRDDVIRKLLQLLAFQLGSEVSFQELANNLKVNVRTVTRYIDLLEKAFIVFRLTPFSRNLRKEITKKNKIYFYDLGIRNSIIQQYQSLDLRPDKGALWENYLLIERLKALSIKQIRPNIYFWRTHDGQEIDYLEERDGQLFAYEFKWKIHRKKIPPAFAKAYPDAKVQWVDTSNFDDFLHAT